MHHRVVIAGSGFSGLGTAIGLERTGRPDYLVLERGTSVGGTWRDNSYPGCACDVPSHLYSFSFAMNPSWSHSFSRQPQIEAYLQKTARDFGVLPKMRFDSEVVSATWDETAQRWDVETTQGAMTCDVFVAATGPLSDASYPTIDGLETFAGTSFHSAAWDHSYDLAGKRVAVIGTGASAIQFIPQIQPQVASLTLFQRTAPWVMPRRDREVAAWEKTLYARLPLLQRAVRTGIYVGRESWIMGFHRPKVMKALGGRALRHLEKQVSDPVLRAKLTPNFTLGCKRVLLSNTYYPALAADNAEVVTDRIVEVVPSGVVTAGPDGVRTTHEVDAIIYGTGFRVSNPPIAERIHAGGRALSELWGAAGMQAYQGLAIHGFPNLYFLVGPNTGLGHNSIVLMIEAQVDHFLQALDAMDARGLATLQPRADVQDAYNLKIQRDLKTTVWNAGGCSSWYLDKTGRNTTLWPTFTWTYIRAMKQFDLDAYETTEREPVSAAGR